MLKGDFVFIKTTSHLQQSLPDIKGDLVLSLSSKVICAQTSGLPVDYSWKRWKKERRDYGKVKDPNIRHLILNYLILRLLMSAVYSFGIYCIIIAYSVLIYFCILTCRFFNLFFYLVSQARRAQAYSWGSSYITADIE